MDRSVVPVGNLQTSGNPDVEHTDVDECDDYGSSDHDHPCFILVHGDDADTVDDDLKQKLHLDAPAEHLKELAAGHRAREDCFSRPKREDIRMVK